MSAGQFVTLTEIDAGLLVYMPAANANGIGYASFTFQVRDDGGTDAGGFDLDPTPDTIAFDVAAVNDAPTFTDLFGAVASGSEDTELAFGFADLLEQSDATDIDGTVSAFVVTAVTSGTLRIGTSALTASAYAAGSNDVIDATRHAYWTPASNAWGTLSAMTLSARDDAGRQSAGPVVAGAIVLPVADAPGVSPATSHEDVPTASGLVVARNAADGAEVTHFQISAIDGGTLFLHDGTTPVLSGAFITAAQGGAGLVFVPTADAVTAGSFSVRGASAAHAGALGHDITTATVTVLPVNDAPVLSALNDLAIYVSGSTNHGTRVLDLIAGHLSDVDAAAEAGVAIVDVDATHGRWEYTLDGGVRWDAIGAVSEHAALLLAADAGVAIRFVPAAGYLGRASIDVRAWDRTSGVAGARADVSVHGGVTAYSAARQNAHATVSSAPPVPAAAVVAENPSNLMPSEASVEPTAVEGASGETSTPAPKEPRDALVSPRDAPSSSGRAAATPSAAAQEGGAVEVPLAAAPAPSAPISTNDAGGAVATPPQAAGAPSAAMSPFVPQSLPAGSNGVAAPADVALFGQDFVARPEKSAEALGGQSMREALDAVRESVQQERTVETQIAAASVAVTGSLSAGYVMWLVRGGVLATSLMSSLPAWRVLDPLPVLSHRARRSDEDDESLETMVGDDASPEDGANARDVTDRSHARNPHEAIP